MPGMNGYELARALRALPGYEAVPMVAVTGYSEFDDRGEAFSAGFTVHMTKPIDPQSLLDLFGRSVKTRYPLHTKTQQCTFFHLFFTT
jgi:CheY-like chemotaxis protein